MYLQRRESSLPLPTFESLQDEMNRLFGHVSRGDFGSGGTRAWAPPVEIYDKDDKLFVVAELPGLEKDAINISFEDGRLSLSGERKAEAPEGQNYHRDERWYGRFERSFQLPAAYDPEKIEAQLRNGILIVSLPKKEEAKARQIPVSVK